MLDLCPSYYTSPLYLHSFEMHLWIKSGIGGEGGLATKCNMSPSSHMHIKMLHVTTECFHGEFMYWDGMLYMFF